jgi:coenzyme F420 hydrogenase subunit beta
MEVQPSEGQAQLIAEVIDRGICVRCGACVGLCPYFDYFDGKVVVLDRCNADTWRCLQVCPRAECKETFEPVSSDGSAESEKIGPHQRIFMARSTDEKCRTKGQYGGVVTTLIRYALRAGDIESAVLTGAGDHLSPGGTLVQKESEVIACAGSRYSGAGGLSALNKAIEAGESNIGVVGLPCQMEALDRLKLTKPDGGERFSRVSARIGLFCTWALDYRQLNDFLRTAGVEGSILKYDIPPPPAETFIIQNEKDVREFALSDIRPLVQKGCALCGDMTAERADISVGAAEGFEGWNTVIVRTEIGDALADRAIEEHWLEIKDLPEENLGHLKEASRIKRERAKNSRSEAGRSQP